MTRIDRDYPEYTGIEHFEDYEYTNNMLYEFYKRSLSQDEKIEDYELNPKKYDDLSLKDILLFETIETKFTLQEIIYNCYPDLYDNVQNSSLIKDKVNHSVSVEVFLEGYHEWDFNPVVYKDLEKNELIKVSEKEILEKIKRAKLFRRLEVNHTKKQLKIKENKFVDIYNLNLALPDSELLAQLKQLRKLHNQEEGRVIKYKNFIYNPLKLADILFIYDKFKHEKSKEEKNIKKIVEQIQFEILYSRRQIINTRDSDDFLKCKIPESKEKKINSLLNSLYYLLNDLYIEDFKDELEDENKEKIRETVNAIYNLIDKNYRNKFIPYVPFLSTRTIYKYLDIAKYYIDEKNYTELLN